jgi:hypothetical protein
MKPSTPQESQARMDELYKTESSEASERPKESDPLLEVIRGTRERFGLPSTLEVKPD